MAHQGRRRHPAVVNLLPCEGKKDMKAIEELDTVELLEDVPGTSLRKGRIGTVVEILAPGAFLVDFVDEDGDELLVDVFTTRQLRLSTSRSEMTATLRVADSRAPAYGVEITPVDAD